MLLSNQTYPSISLLSPCANVCFSILYEIIAVSFFTSADLPQMKRLPIFYIFILGANFNVLLSIAENSSVVLRSLVNFYFKPGYFYYELHLSIFLERKLT